MSFIDYNYFINDINLPLGSKTELRTAINNAIDDYEPEILKKLLGYTLWKALIADLDGDGNPQTQIYTDLVNGAEFSFTYEGHTINTKWEGLRNTDTYKSLLSYYVYYQYRRNSGTNSSGMTELVNKPENADIVSPVYKLTRAWNRMVDLYGQTPLKYFDSKTYFLNQSNYEHYNTEPSAYNFLLANVSNYSDWVFTPIRKINSFGL